jgi:hypothetical protein
MAEFLTREEIRAYYDKLVNKPAYVKTLKKSIDDVKLEQILSYAREVYMESIMRLEREDGLFHPVTSYTFPPCPLFTEVFVLPNGLKLDAFTYRDQLKYWFSTSKRVIQIIEENLKPRHIKIIPTQDLRLADVLIEGESVDEVKSYYNFRKHRYSYLAKFLRILQLMGYFKRKLTSRDFQAIGRNDFDDATYNDNKDNKPPALTDLHKYPEFRDIPRPKKNRNI